MFSHPSSLCASTACGLWSLCANTACGLWMLWMLWVLWTDGRLAWKSWKSLAASCASVSAVSWSTSLEWPRWAGDGMMRPIACSMAAAVAAVVSEVEVKGSWGSWVVWSFSWGRLPANCLDSVWSMSAKSAASFCLSCSAWFQREHSSANAEVRLHNVPSISAICSFSVLDSLEWKVCRGIGRVRLLCVGNSSGMVWPLAPHDMGSGMDVVWVR